MRDLIVFLMVLALLPRATKQPFVGLLLFSWLAYMRPQDLCWGFARTMRMSFFVAFAMLIGWWANEQGKRRFTRWDIRTSLLVLLGVLVTLSYIQARHHNNYTNTYFFEYIKIIVIGLFTVSQCDSRDRLRWMFWTIGLSLGFFAIKNGLLGLLRGGSKILRGPGGMLEDNNDFALAMVMNVPMLWYLAIVDVERRWIKIAMKIGVALCVVTVLLTHSRGGFLALCSTTLWIAWRSGKLIRAGFILLLIGILFPLLAPHEILERLGTIGDTKESSANARLTTWATAFNMIADNPVWGVGLRNFRPRYIEYSVVPISDPNQGFVAHNSYLQIWAESGSIAFLVYLTLLVSAFVACRHVFRLGRSRPDLFWAANYARMMEATMVGFMVGAFFLNRGHFDLVYHWLALVSSLVVVANEAAAKAPVAAGQQQLARHEVSLRRRGDIVATAGPAVSWSRLRPRWR